MLTAAAMLVALGGIAAAQEQEAPAPNAGQNQPDQNRQGIVNYPAAFFARYQPNTALDMVRQIPAFQLDNGGDERGFGASAGNVLVDNRRLSAKQDQPSDILERIPASRVERIELIRGQAGNIDMLGQSVVVNVLLRGDMPAAVRWQGSILKNFIDPSFEYSDTALAVSRSDRFGEIDYNTGISATLRGTADDIDVDVLDSTGNLVEQRLEAQDEDGNSLSGNLNLSTMVGSTLLQLNSRLAVQEFGFTIDSDRTPVNEVGDPRRLIFGMDNNTTSLEVGVDAERSLANDWIGKAIVLYAQSDADRRNTQRIIEEAAGQTLFRQADADVESSETIARLEFDWSAWSGHAVQLNVEGALNVIDGSLVQTDDTGSGPMPVDVPFGNTRVEELRGDLLLKDTWTLGDWVLDYGLGAEFSEITQTGDGNRKRNFSFVKPQGLVIWSPRRGVQTRMRVVREVAQLNLQEFVTTTQFQDDNLLLGGDDLEPESTWISELTYERRFGELGVMSLTGFHHWISDAQDFVPLTDQTDAPGNIGDARRWGLELESTLSLDWLGLNAARLDLKMRLQDSTVTDPVTGSARKLTGRSEHQGPPNFMFTRDNNNDLIVDLAFRQDFQDAQVAWGWDIADRSERTWFKVNELNVYDEDGVEMNIFVETTRWLGVKIRLEASNLDDFVETRDRTLYTGRRGLSPVLRRELTNRTEGRRLTLTVSGAF
jgi:hypothetical protein